MIIKKITLKAHDKLLSNVKSSYENVKSRYINLNEPFNFINDNIEIISSGSYEIGNITLIDDTNGSYDFDNAKIIYTAFSNLTPTEANDERLWVTLTHHYFHKYCVTRWMNQESKKDSVIDRFFYEGNSLVARSRNAISRLWWTAYLTINNDTDNEDLKWALTKTIFSTQDIQVSLLERKLGLYENIRTPFLEFYQENKEIVNSKMIQKIIRELNNYGGVISLTELSKEDVKTLIQSFI
jgi:hypothetical protein